VDRGLSYSDVCTKRMRCETNTLDDDSTQAACMVVLVLSVNALVMTAGVMSSVSDTCVGDMIRKEVAKLEVAKLEVAKL